MTTQIEATPTEVRDNAYWPDEALLTDFAEMADRTEQADQPLENNPEYAALYFVP